MKQEFYLGIDIGGTKCAVVGGDSDFTIFSKVQFDTRTAERGWQDVFEEFFANIDRLFLKYPKENLRGIGIS